MNIYLDQTDYFDDQIIKMDKERVLSKFGEEAIDQLSSHPILFFSECDQNACFKSDILIIIEKKYTILLTKFYYISQEDFKYYIENKIRLDDWNWNDADTSYIYKVIR